MISRTLLQRRLFAAVAFPVTAGLLGLAIAAAYLVAVLRTPHGMRWLVVGLLCGLAGMALYAAQAYWRLRPVRRLLSDAGPPSASVLRSAVGALLAFPDRAFVLAIEGWAFAVAASAITLKLAGDDWPAVVRVLLAGVWAAPMSSLLVHLTSILQCRAAVADLCSAGLSAVQLVEVAPPRRAQLQVRLVAFTAMAVITPVTLTADVASTESSRAFAQIAQVRGAGGQRGVADDLRAAGQVEVASVSALALAVALLTAFAAGTVIARPMRSVAEEATRIAAGKVDAPRPLPADDEVWALCAAFTLMQAHLLRLLSELKRAGDQIGGTTDEILTTSARHEEGATEQATALNETSATTEELARSARQIAENAGSVADIAQNTLKVAKEGQDGADAFGRAMGRMEQDNRAIADAVIKLNKRVQQIGRIVEFINGVADKSDLLALNAELEGTKAGEVGRGFSLVAAEMRRLAENVLESTKEIEGLIEEIREATSAAVAATEAGVRATETGGALAREVTQSLREIVELAGQTSDAVRAISLATQQQQTGTDQLAETMADILRVTQQSLAATKQVSSANVDLGGLSQELKEVVGRFRVAGGERS